MATPAREEEQGVNKVPANLLALPAVPWALSMRYPAIVQQDAGGLVVSVTVPSAAPVSSAKSAWYIETVRQFPMSKSQTGEEQKITIAPMLSVRNGARAIE